MTKSFTLKGVPSDIVVSIDVNEAREIGKWARAVDIADFIMSYQNTFGVDSFDEAMEIASESIEKIADLITGEDEELIILEVIRNRRRNYEK